MNPALSGTVWLPSSTGRTVVYAAVGFLFLSRITVIQRAGIIHGRQSYPFPS